MRNSAAVLFAALLSLAQAAAAPSPITPRVGLAENQGFCSGTPPEWGWPTPKPPGIRLWTTLCGPPAAQPATATAVTESFRAPAHLSLYLLGWMKPHKQGMALENVATGEKLAINPNEVPGGEWLPLTFNVPDAWRGRPVRLIVHTQLSEDLTWVGFSEPFDAGDIRDYKATLLVFLRLIEYYLLLSLPFFAAAAAALRKDIRDSALLLFFGLAGAGVAGYAAFWLWFLVPKLGHLYSFLVPLVSAVYLVWIWRGTNRGRRKDLSAIAVPWLVTFSFALFVVAAGFLFGGLENPLDTAKARFSHQLPMDNELQYVFSEQIISRKILHPMIGDWLSSDRPPLETGFTLLQLPYVMPPRRLAYMLLAILLQSFWAPSLWAFLRALDIRKNLIGWILVAALFSGFVLINSFFVWPKLLAAAYTIGFSALLLSPRLAAEMKSRKSVALLAGTLLALGVLSHGGSAFALLGLIPTLLVLRRRVPLRAIVLSGTALLALYLPWMAYQKFYDPPGDRLLKMHLAGVDKPTSQSFPQVTRDAYAKASWEDIVNARRTNAQTIIGPQATYWRTIGDFLARLPSDLLFNRRDAGATAATVRVLQFFHFFPALGFYMAGPILVLAGIFLRFRNTAWRAALVCWVYVLFTLILWCATMFVPKGAIIVSGTYVANLMAITGGVLAVWAVSRWLAVAIVIFQSVFSFFLYVVYGKQSPAPGRLAEGALHRGELLLLIASLILLWFVLRLACRDKEMNIAPVREHVA